MYWDKGGKYDAQVGPAAIGALLGTSIYFILVLVLLLHGANKRQPVNLVAASAIMAHLLLGLMVHSGTIHLEFFYKAMTAFSCWAHQYLKTLYFIIVPYNLVAFTIDRLLFVRFTTRYVEKLKYSGLLQLLVMPWAIAIAFAAAGIFASARELHLTGLGIQQWNLNETQHYCEWKTKPKKVDTGVLSLALAICPILCGVIITFILICFGSCCQKKINQGEELDTPLKARAKESIAAVAILNSAMIAVFVIEPETYWEPLPLPLPLAPLTLLGALEGLVWIFLMHDVRGKLLFFLNPCAQPTGSMNDLKGEGTDDSKETV